MKKFIYPLAVIFFIALSVEVSAADSPKKIMKTFSQRVVNHDLKGSLALLDGSYKQVQLIGTLGNDTTQFVNELFCGNNVSEKFTCVNFQDISKCTCGKIGTFVNQDNNVSYAPVVLKIETTSGEKIMANLTVVKITTATGFLYRIAGSVG